ncbi:Prp19-domain-containing protein [Metschnikowia bicuspidata]|uniref:Pre-mRNA-processing factor 19 n=1 Tax=Metschnikowia bicuspidata TaxID=27322 RepID=A0A4P9ZDA4_9ASCO|nr:Prp19-domain-containing protein [Metschnikowia bicuspidata]
MLCALSGEPISEAVVSPKSGAVFERRLIETYLATAEKDPINDEPLSASELIPLATASPIVPPKPPSFSSIPTMLAAFQNEWDALALETYTLRKQLHDARLEVSNFMYKYEAAVRVAARVTKERDEAQTALRELTEALAAGNIHNPENARVIPVDRLLLARERLFGIHKKEKISLPITKDSAASVSIVSRDKVNLYGLTSVAVHAQTKRSLCLGTFGATLLPDNISCTSASVAGFLTENDVSTAISVYDGHLNLMEKNITKSVNLRDITLLATHPSEALFIVANKQNQWILADSSGPIFTSEPVESISALAFHVDGILLAVAGDSIVDIFDITSTQKVSSVNVGKGKITKVDFAFNGYWIITSSVNNENEGSVDIYDLRKNALVYASSFKSPAEFVLDPSSQVLVTYEHEQRKLQVHLYGKKSKAWIEASAEVESPSLLAFDVESTPDEVQELKQVNLVGYADSEVVHYLIGFEGKKLE